jgi:hypothetical protein
MFGLVLFGILFRIKGLVEYKIRQTSVKGYSRLEVFQAHIFPKTQKMFFESDPAMSRNLMAHL